MYVSYATPRCLASRAPSFQGLSQFFFIEIHLAVSLSMNSRITHCCYYVICEQLRTIGHNTCHASFLQMSEIMLHKDKASLDITVAAHIML